MEIEEKIKAIIEIKKDSDTNTVTLTNSKGDTYTSKSSELKDFLIGCEQSELTKLKAENEELKESNKEDCKWIREKSSEQFSYLINLIDLKEKENTQLKEKLKELETELEKPWWKTKKY